MSNMKDVTESEFFAALYADKRDIMPRIVSGWNAATGYASEWRTADQRTLFGLSQSGNAHGTGEGVRYQLAEVNAC